MTKYGTEILRIVVSSAGHLTAEQIYDELRKCFPRVALATVYNNLNRLWQEGRIRKVSVEGMPDRYDHTARHDHLICRRCGRLADVELADLAEQVEKQVGVPILAYDLKLVYLCDMCRKELEKEGG